MQPQKSPGTSQPILCIMTASCVTPRPHHCSTPPMYAPRMRFFSRLACSSQHHCFVPAAPCVTASSSCGISNGFPAILSDVSCGMPSVQVSQDARLNSRPPVTRRRTRDINRMVIGRRLISFQSNHRLRRLVMFDTVSGTSWMKLLLSDKCFKRCMDTKASDMCRMRLLFMDKEVSEEIFGIHDWTCTNRLKDTDRCSSFIFFIEEGNRRNRLCSRTNLRILRSFPKRRGSCRGMAAVRCWFNRHAFNKPTAQQSCLFPYPR